MDGENIALRNATASRQETANLEIVKDAESNSMQSFGQGSVMIEEYLIYAN